MDEHIIYGLFFCIPLNFCVIISCTSCNLLFTNKTPDPATSQSKQRMDQLLVLAPRIVSGVHHCVFLRCNIHVVYRWHQQGLSWMAEFVPSANELPLTVFTDNQIADPEVCTMLNYIPETAEPAHSSEPWMNPQPLQRTHDELLTKLCSQCCATGVNYFHFHDTK